MVKIDFRKVQEEGHLVEMRLGEARDLLDDLLDLRGIEDLVQAVDEAQGSVHSGPAVEAYVIIRIYRAEEDEQDDDR